MFLDEARLAARIRHMNVVPTLDISDSPGDGYFLVMEYIEGNHLGVLLGNAAKRGERLPRPFVFRVLIDALQGLGAAHRLTDEHGKPLKLVHRDVSPHNILVGTDGIARLTDFGVAKADVRMASTRAGQFKGKLSYMAPEQAASNETDQRSDLFSTGIILWESLTGRRLFKGESNGATLNKLLNDPIVKPSELIPDLERYDAVVMKALDRDPEGRFQSADEFAEALDHVAGRTGVAKTRHVAEVVRDLDAEKLDDQRRRVRDAIELLGRAEIAVSSIPMPRDSRERMSHGELPSTASESSVHGRTVDAAQEEATLPERRESSLLRWLVMVLAIVVFVYAGFLSWRLLGPTAPRAPIGIEPVPATTVPATVPIEVTEPADAAPTEPEPEPKPARLEDDAQRKTRAAPSPRRRRPRRRPASDGPRAIEAREPPAQPGEPETRPEPVDIDITNPYRN